MGSIWGLMGLNRVYFGLNRVYVGFNGVYMGSNGVKWGLIWGLIRSIWG